MRQISQGSIGIIPAHAGKGPRCCWTIFPRWNHPRACGERPAPPVPPVPIETSSPRMRGKADHGISSCAGSEDHPRACGEKSGDRRRETGRSGSPPRARGKEKADGRGVLDAGITPARAGKRLRPASIPSKSGDHPRACGEKRNLKPALPSRRGSPPRVRGKAPVAVLCTGKVGITPARAGKSILIIRRDCIHWDHPRACGEKNMMKTEKMDFLGSPPRVRGKARCPELSEAELSITPARAGKSSHRRIGGCAVRDHPRACGEKRSSQTCETAAQGSPPRVRGKAAGRKRFTIG